MRVEDLPQIIPDSDLYIITVPQLDYYCDSDTLCPLEIEDHQAFYIPRKVAIEYRFRRQFVPSALDVRFDYHYNCPLDETHITGRCPSSVRLDYQTRFCAVFPLVAIQFDPFPIICSKKAAKMLGQLEASGLFLNRAKVTLGGTRSRRTPTLYLVRMPTQLKRVQAKMASDFSNRCPSCGYSPFICPGCQQIVFRCPQCNERWQEVCATTVFPRISNPHFNAIDKSSIEPGVDFYENNVVTRAGLEFLIEHKIGPLSVEPLQCV